LAVDVNLLLEIADHLIVIGAQIVLSDVILLQLPDKVTQLLELILVEIALQHELEDVLLLDLEINQVQQEQNQPEELQWLIVDIHIRDLLVNALLLEMNHADRRSVKVFRNEV
jgi:hypothetical protein